MTDDTEDVCKCGHIRAKHRPFMSSQTACFGVPADETSMNLCSCMSFKKPEPVVNPDLPTPTMCEVCGHPPEKHNGRDFNCTWNGTTREGYYATCHCQGFRMPGWKAAKLKDREHI